MKKLPLIFIVIIGGKTENRREKVENNSNVSISPSIPGQSKTYHAFFDATTLCVLCNFFSLSDRSYLDLIDLCLYRCPSWKAMKSLRGQTSFLFIITI